MAEEKLIRLISLKNKLQQINMLFATRQLSGLVETVPKVLSTSWTRATVKIKGKSQMALFAALLDSAEYLSFTLFYGVSKSLKSYQSCKISKQSVTGVRMEKCRPLERAQVANQIIGPLRSWQKEVKYLLPVCQILWHFTDRTAKKVTVRFFLLCVHAHVRKCRKRKPRVTRFFFKHAQIT